MWMLLGILVVGALGGVCMAALRNVSGDVGGGMGRDYMEKEWGINSLNAASPVMVTRYFSR